MKSFSLSLSLVFVLLWAWRFAYDDASLVRDLRRIIVALQEERAGANNVDPFIVIVENKWADALYPLWENGSRFVLLTPWDLNKGYGRRKKRFNCYQDVYWIGEAAPAQQLLKIGTWAPLDASPQPLPASWQLHKMTQKQQNVID